MSVHAEYICRNCKRTVSREELKTMPGVKCPHCGSRILIRVRPPRIKVVKSG